MNSSDIEIGIRDFVDLQFGMEGERAPFLHYIMLRQENVTWAAGPLLLCGFAREWLRRLLQHALCGSG